MPEIVLKLGIDGTAAKQVLQSLDTYIKSIDQNAHLNIDVETGELRAASELIKRLGGGVEGQAPALNRWKQGLSSAYLVLGGLRESADMLRGTFAPLQQAYFEQDAALRKLESAAKLTGESLRKMEDEAAESKEKFQLTTAQSNELVLTLTQLGKKAGDTTKVKESLEGLLNTAASKGMGAQEALEALKMTMMGEDTGTDKLFGMNPSAIHEQWAKAHDVIASKMTETQKRQAELNIFVAMANDLSGERAKRMESEAGKQEILSNQMLEMKANAGELMTKGISPIVWGLSQFVGGVNEGSKTASGMIGLLGTGTIAFVTLRTAGIIPAISSMGIFRGVVAAYTAQSVAAAAGTNVMTIGFRAAATSVRAFFAAMGPISWAITAVGLLATGIYAVSTSANDLSGIGEQLGGEFRQIGNEAEQAATRIDAIKGSLAGLSVAQLRQKGLELMLEEKDAQQRLTRTEAEINEMKNKVEQLSKDGNEFVGRGGALLNSNQNEINYYESEIARLRAFAGGLREQRNDIRSLRAEISGMESRAENIARTPNPVVAPSKPAPVSTSSTNTPKTKPDFELPDWAKNVGLTEDAYKKLTQSGISSMRELANASRQSLDQIATARTLDISNLVKWKDESERLIAGKTIEEWNAMKTLDEKRQTLAGRIFEHGLASFLGLRKKPEDDKLVTDAERIQQELLTARTEMEKLDGLGIENLNDKQVEDYGKALDRVIALEKELPEALRKSRTESERLLREQKALMEQRSDLEFENNERDRISKITAHQNVGFAGFRFAKIDLTKEQQEAASATLERQLLERKKGRLNEELQAVKNNTELQADARITEEERVALRIAEINRDITKAKQTEAEAQAEIQRATLEKTAGVFNKIATGFSQGGQIASEIDAIRMQRLQKRFEKERELMEKSLDAEKRQLLGVALTQRQRDRIEQEMQERKEKREEELQAKFKAEARKTFIFKQAAAIGEVAFNTAANVTKTLVPPNPLLTAFVVATGALQAAKIAAQPIPGFYAGGRVFGDEQIIRVNEIGEEMVMNHRAVERFEPELNLMNQGVSPMLDISSEIVALRKDVQGLGRELARQADRPIDVHASADIERYKTSAIVVEGNRQMRKNAI